MIRQTNQVAPIAALYARLSKDDEQQGETNSISNQKRILETYAREHGIMNYRFFVDDGWSGANFEIPGFKEMMDGVDSIQGDNGLTPLKNLFNEWMVRDTSKKIRAVKKAKGMSGKPVTSRPV